MKSSFPFRSTSPMTPFFSTSVHWVMGRRTNVACCVSAKAALSLWQARQKFDPM